MFNYIYAFKNIYVLFILIINRFYENYIVFMENVKKYDTFYESYYFMIK